MQDSYDRILKIMEDSHDKSIRETLYDLKDYRILTPYEYILIGGDWDKNKYPNPRIPIGDADGSLPFDEVVKQRRTKVVLVSNYALKMFGLAGEEGAHRDAVVFGLVEVGEDTHEVREELPPVLGTYDPVEQKLNRDPRIIERLHYTVEDVLELPNKKEDWEGESTQR